ncbi:MAG: TonB family protein [Gammaproteobacteria bacterium]|nr:TonB family protein [Gammaproteobacteria bacterium]NVK88500.1 TonB family protein [Gammaproteobacteria bacterium]
MRLLAALFFGAGAVVVLMIVMSQMVNANSSQGNVYQPLAEVDILERTLVTKIRPTKEVPPEPKQEPLKQRVQQPPQDIKRVKPQLVAPIQSAQSFHIALGPDVDTRSLIGDSITAEQDTLADSFAMVSRVEPIYPVDARIKGLEGEVTLRLEVDNAGKVIAVEVLKATPKGVFERSAMRAVYQWNFKSSGAESVAGFHEVSLSFALDQAG